MPLVRATALWVEAIACKFERPHVPPSGLGEGVAQSQPLVSLFNTFCALSSLLKYAIAGENKFKGILRSPSNVVNYYLDKLQRPFSQR